MRYRDTALYFTDDHSDAAQLAPAVGCQRDAATWPPPPRPQPRARAFATFLSARTGDASRERIARERWPDDPVTPLLLQQKAAVSGASTTDPAWAGATAAQVVGDFFSSLAPLSAAGRLMNAGLRLGLDGENAVLIPRRSGLLATDVGGSRA